MKENVRFYRCPICDNVIGLIDGDMEHIKCCGKPMEQMIANTTDASTEKHVPVYEQVDKNKFFVKVGSEPHPMVKEHYIMFVESISEDKNRLKLQYLHPEQDAKMFLEEKLGKEKALEFCNIHGLWEGQSD